MMTPAQAARMAAESRPDFDPPARVTTVPSDRAPTPKPDHYKVICISLYNADLARLDAMVEQLKAAGHTKANRSALIRLALDQVDLSKAIRGL